MNEYWCKHCKSILLRDSTKAWIKSFCGIKGREARIVRVAAAK